MSLKDDLKRIVLNPSRGNIQQLSGPNQREAIPASTGTAIEAGVGGDSIASPLIEYAPGDIDGYERTYHPAREETSSDGLFVREFQQIQTIKMLDDNGETVEFEYRDTDPTDYPP